MPATVYSPSDYLAALQGLLPRGIAWSTDPDSTQAKLLSGLATPFSTSNQAASDLITQAFPATADEMLPEWQSALGLPGIYGVNPPTLQGQQDAVVAALTDTGGQSTAYFVGLAATLGYTISVTQFRAYNVNAPVTTPIALDAWAHTWMVNASASIATHYTITADVVPVTAGFGNPLLDSVLGLFKPAHTVVITSYT